MRSSLEATPGALHPRKEQSMLKFLMRANLRLFDGEGGGSSAPAAAEGAQGEPNGTVPGNTRRGKTGETKTLYGKQPEKPEKTAESTAQGASSDAGSDNKRSTKEERRKTFLDMANGEYKDIYTEETRRMIDRRFKETQALETAVNQYKPIVDTLMQRYKIENGDLAKLAVAIENDDAYWAAAAEEAGMSVTEFKEIARLKRENSALTEEARRRRSQEQQDAQIAAWHEQSIAVKAAYPDFDLATECENAEFLKLLRSNVPMMHAYRLIHMDELMANAVKGTEKRVVDNVRAKGQRPSENGTSPTSAFTIKSDVNKLTKADRAEIAARIARGEIISF